MHAVPATARGQPPLPTLRPALAEDSALLRQIFAGTRAEEMALMPLPDAQKDQLLEMQFRAQDGQYRSTYPGACFDLVLLHGAVVGRLYVDRSASHIVLIDISLLPQYRGGGVGTQLLLGLRREAGATGRPVLLQVRRGNRALRLYHALGFTITGDSGAYFSMQWEPAGQDGANPPSLACVKADFKEHQYGTTIPRAN